MYAWQQQIGRLLLTFKRDLQLNVKNVTDRQTNYLSALVSC